MADSLNIAKEIFESDDFDSALRELYTSAWSDSNSAVCYVLSIAPDNGGWFEFAVIADSAMVRNGDPVETGEITTILRVPAVGDDACEIEDYAIDSMIERLQDPETQAEVVDRIRNAGIYASDGSDVD